MENAEQRFYFDTVQDDKKIYCEYPILTFLRRCHMAASPLFCPALSACSSLSIVVCNEMVLQPVHTKLTDRPIASDGHNYD